MLAQETQMPQTVEHKKVAVDEIDHRDSAIEHDLDTPITLTEDGGVVKTIHSYGTGQRPESGDDVFVNYIGTLVAVDGVEDADKPVFDSNEDKANPFKFVLDHGMVIKGWDIGVATMRKGEVATFVLKPDYAYGETGSGSRIPPNSTLQFKVTLLDFKSAKSLTNDNKVTLDIIVPQPIVPEKPRNGSEVVVSYTGRLNNAEGSVFVEKDNFSWIVGDKNVQLPPYFAQAIYKIRKGEVGRLSVKAEHAYGLEGNTELGVPPNADLVYDISLKELYSVSTHEKGAITKKMIREGQGWAQPKDAAKVKMNCRGYSVPSNIELLSLTVDQEVELGSGVLPEVLELGVLEMKEGEKAIIKGPKEWCFGTTKQATLPSLANEDAIVFEVELKSFDKAREAWEMQPEEKLEDGNRCRLLGNGFFKEGQYKLAIQKYSKALAYFQYEAKEWTEELKQKINAMRLPCHLNLAACFLKSNDHNKVIEHTRKALQIDAKSVKAMYRQAQSLVHLQEFEEAQKVLVQATEVDPEEKTIKLLLQQVQSKIKLRDERDKKVYARMFS